MMIWKIFFFFFSGETLPSFRGKPLNFAYEHIGTGARNSAGGTWVKGGYTPSEGVWYCIITRWWQLKYFSFSSLPGEMIQFDDHIFQMGWNHQLD